MMKCPKCNNAMKEEIIFTSVNYSCNCENGWQTISELLEFIKPMDLPIKLKFMDPDGRSGSVFVGDMEYFSRCHKERKFKVQRSCSHDYYIGLTKGMTEAEVAKALYGYSIDSDDDDGC